MKPSKIYFKSIVFLITVLSFSSSLKAQETVARQWNELILEAIRDDFARPTVHARNLFHTSLAMYDAWAVFSPTDETYLLGKTLNGYECEFEGIASPSDVQAARNEAISYAITRMIEQRFQFSPGASATLTRTYALMNDLGYDFTVNTTDYSTGSYAALGNYIAACLIEYGLQDGSNEIAEYSNQFYQPINPPLLPAQPGNPDIFDPNHWQPLALDSFVDQSGNVIPGDVRDFLSPEWGSVLPFSLQPSDKTTYQVSGNFYDVYFDPGPPPYIDDPATRDDYMWNFALVSVWGAHCDPADSVMWDISPASIGNITTLPTTPQGIRDFYKLEEGGDQSQGWSMNPVTGQPYEPQIVPRGDYARILAEFWADGPDSETPPGHWFTILNYVNDHPLLEKKFRGQGEVLDDLEWDVKSYFILGGTMHDVAITAWGIKGYYDYIRPISAIRYMGDKGQSTDTSLSNYHEEGLPLIDGFIEVVEVGDPLAGDSNQHLNKIKVYSWKGPTFINDPEVDQAGVGWILAENWWSYQRPTFVTPPFAGYVSGHSTYSRAAAEVLTALTGDAFFPGGVGEFEAPKNEFLVFEEGPSMDITLQWATYRDASDQCSLSRIWGGIHPPIDDIPGRIIGKEIGVEAFEYAANYFDVSTSVSQPTIKSLDVFPNPIKGGGLIKVNLPNKDKDIRLCIVNAAGQVVYEQDVLNNTNILAIPTEQLAKGMHVIKLMSTSTIYQSSIMVQ